jgi:hypothetical protein
MLSHLAYEGFGATGQAAQVQRAQAQAQAQQAQALSQAPPHQPPSSDDVQIVAVRSLQ